MRFRRSIRIMKGVRLNLSKSGISLTAGVRGASINVGSRGTFVNTGVPGTGIYDRKRIGGTNYSRQSSSGSNRSYVDLSITVGIDDAGTYFIKDQDGNIITDDSLLRKIKRTEAYKDKIRELSERFATDKNEENQKFIDIYKLSPELIKKEAVLYELESMKPEVYIREVYTRKAPDSETIRNEIIAEAKRSIHSFAFWTLKRKRNEFFESRFPIVLKEEQRKYEEEKSQFTRNEDDKEKQKNKEYIENYERAKDEMRKFLSGDKNWVEEKIDIFLEGMVLPVDFSVSYEYLPEGLLKVDLDLPEIEDLPSTKVTTLTSGKVKVKEKTQKELKEEYIRCISGLAFFFAFSLLNISTHISQILISGFTQRTNKKTGNISDDYVYSIIFTRNGLEELNILNIDPIIAFESFHHIWSISKTFDIATIIPFNDFNI